MGLFGELNDAVKAAKASKMRYSGGGSPFGSSTSDLMRTKYAPHPNEGIASAGRTVDNMPKSKGVFKAAGVKQAKEALAKKKAESIRTRPAPGSITKAPARVPLYGPKSSVVAKVDDLFGVSDSPRGYM